MPTLPISMHDQLAHWRELWRLGIDKRNPPTPNDSQVSTRHNADHDPCRYVSHQYTGPRECGSPHRQAIREHQ